VSEWVRGRDGEEDLKSVVELRAVPCLRGVEYRSAWSGDLLAISE
jgi:hypothetical protein